MKKIQLMCLVCKNLLELLAKDWRKEIAVVHQMDVGLQQQWWLIDHGRQASSTSCIVYASADWETCTHHSLSHTRFKKQE